MDNADTVKAYKTKIRNNIERVESYCFFIALVCWLIWKITGTSMLSIPDGSSLNTAIHFSLLGLFALSFLRHIRIDTNFWMALIFGAVGVLVKVFADDFMFIDLAVILYAGSRFDFKQIAKVCLIVCAACCALIVVCSQIGVIQDYPFTRGSQIRHGLGFLYSTFLSHYYLNIVLLYLYLRPQPKLIELGGLLVVDIAIYLATDSRNAFLLVILVLIFVLVAPGLKKIAGPKLVAFGRGLTKWVFLICAVLCFILPLAYNPSDGIWHTANSISSNRLAQTQASIFKYGVSPFGQDIDFNGNGLTLTENGVETSQQQHPDGDGNYIDSSFVQVCIKTGLAIFLCLMVILVAASFEISSQGSILLCFFVFIIAFHCSIDDLLVDINYNAFLFLFWNSAVIQINKVLKSKQKVKA